MAHVFTSTLPLLASVNAALKQQVAQKAKAMDMGYALYTAWIECEIDPDEALESMLYDLLH